MAIFAKQSAIYLPILLLFYLVFFLQNYRWAVIALLTATVTFGLLLVLSGQNDFHAFLQNTVQGVNNGVSFSWFAERIMVEHFQKERFINILGLFGGFYFLAKGKSHPLKFLGTGSVGFFLFCADHQYQDRGGSQLFYGIYCPYGDCRSGAGGYLRSVVPSATNSSEKMEGVPTVVLLDFGSIHLTASLCGQIS